MERSAWPKNLSSSRKHEIQEFLHAQDRSKKLRHLFDAHSQTGNNTAQPLFAEDLVFNVVRSFSNTLSLSSGPESDEVLQVPTNACVRFEVSEESIKPNACVRPEVSEESINTPSVPTNACVGPEVSEESTKPPPVPRTTPDTWTRLDQNLIDEGHEWSTDDQDQQSILNSQFPRKTSDSITIVTTDLKDGHQWRKYGQRPILNSEFPRQYFRCGHKIDRGCQATKQVQKTKDDPPLYMTTYRGNHTCKNLLVESPQLILDSPSPREDDLNPSLIAEQDDGNNNNPIFNYPIFNYPFFLDFLSVNQEQKLPSEDDLNPHGHSFDAESPFDRICRLACEHDRSPERQTAFTRPKFSRWMI